ncbi:aldehyde dehydrogenase family protein, partial [Acinetobacter baumannii]
DDADLDAAIEGAMISKYRNGGQTCVCSNRMYVQSGLYDAFVERLASRASKLVLGDGRAPRTQIGPLIDARALEKISELVEDARSQG